MKRIAFTAILCLASAFVAFSQLACRSTAPDTNRAVSSTPSNTNSEKEPVNTAAIEAELLRIERDFPRVIRERDVEAIRRVEADDAVMVYPDGSLGNKEQDIKDTEAGTLSADSWEVTDLKVNVLNADAAVVSGRAIVKGGKLKRPDGKTIDISGQYRFIDTFARRNGQWKLVAGAGTPVQAPPAESATSPSAAKPSPAKPSPAKPSPSPKSTN
ncbi:MAG TPA: nuclear transport factor 2 family protein [Pyrinomonadaceae bacterium]|nr:nuclear transport factor 2 family protein [Pyrinomonadaceae bacterium]